MTATALKYIEPVSSTKITANKFLYIKLGGGGEWEEDCIEKSNTLRLGFNEADFQSCVKGDWTKIKKDFINMGCSKGVASSYVRQVKRFFTEPEDTIWITFYNRKLWWTRAKADKISLEEDGSRTRSCLSKWSDQDIEGNTLSFDKISGKLLKTQGYRSTICNVKEKDYLLRKINAEKSKEVSLTEESYKSLENNLCKLIQHLTWQDFELLIDLIFTHAGWKRTSEVGGKEKTVDLVLKSPVTNEKCFVQIKSKSDNNQLEKYLKKFKLMDKDETHKFFYVYHTGQPLKVNDNKTNGIKLLSVKEISKLAIDSGLSQWIIDKVS